MGDSINHTVANGRSADIINGRKELQCSIL